MIPDPKWLDALKLPLKVTIAVSLSSGILLTFELTKLLDLGLFGPYMRPFLIILTVVFTVLSLVGIADYFLLPIREKRKQSLLSVRRAIRLKENEEMLEGKRSEILDHLNFISKEELRYVADCLHNGSPSFYAYFYSPPVSLLLGKGLVWTPGGQHHQDHYPFSFQDFVWKELLKRKDELIKKDEEYKRADETAKQAALRSRY